MSKEELREVMYNKLMWLNEQNVKVDEESIDRIINNHWHYYKQLNNILNNLIEYKHLAINQRIINLLSEHKLESIEINRLSNLTDAMINNDWEEFEIKYKNPILRVYQVKNPKHEIFSIYEHNGVDKATLNEAFKSIEDNWAIRDVESNEVVKKYHIYNDFLKETFENNYDGIINKFLVRKNPNYRYF